MNKYLTAIVGILVGVIGILAGLFTSTNSKRKIAEKKAEESIVSQKATEEIAEVISKPTQSKKKMERKSGVLGKMIIILVLGYTLSACAIYEPVCPSLFIIERPNNFEDVRYKYDDINNVYFLSEEDMEQLAYQWNWAKDTISKYEKQINIYNKFKKGEIK